MLRRHRPEDTKGNAGLSPSESSQAQAARYRQHARELRELAQRFQIDANRKRVLEIAAELEELAAGLERDAQS